MEGKHLNDNETELRLQQAIIVSGDASTNVVPLKK